MRSLSLVLIVSALLYFAAACAVFQWRNPTANGAQCFRHLGAVLAWGRIPEFQRRP